MTFILLLLILAASFAASLLFGAENIMSGSKFARIILFDIRLPRTILAAVTGMLLGGAGAAFQLYFRNPLAEPGIMGITSGATLGAVTAGAFTTIPIFATIISPVNTGAFLGAAGAGILASALAGSRRGPSSAVALLLCGTALGTLYSAAASIILLLREKELHALYIWMLGSFNGRGWNDLAFIALPSAAAIILFLLCARPLDLLSGGEQTAQALGLEIRKLRILVMTAGALAASAAVCAGGTIGFVGLIAPHIARRMFGAKSSIVLPLSMVTGAALLLAADTIARTAAAPAEIPVGVIISLLGAPFFISLISSERRLQNGIL